MFTASRLLCGLLSRSDSTLIPGLSHVLQGDGVEKKKIEDIRRSRALILANRIFQAGQLQHVPLPSFSAREIAPGPGMLSVGADDSSAIVRDRHPPIRPETAMGSIKPSKAMRSIVLLPIKNVKQSVVMLRKALLAKQQPTLNSIAIVSAITKSGYTPLGSMSSSPSRFKDLSGAVEAAGGKGQKGFDLQPALAASISNESASRLVPSTNQAVVSKPDIDASDQYRIPSTTFPGILAIQRVVSGTQVAVQGVQAKAAIEAAVQPSEFRTPISWFQSDGPRSAGPTVVLPNQTISLPMPVPDSTPGYLQDPQQQLSSTARFSPSARTSGVSQQRSSEVATTLISIPTVPSDGSGDTAPTRPQLINLTGAVNLDGRRLGRLTASSQAREASLPSRGPSRVNLRTVPVYSGMQIPS